MEKLVVRGGKKLRGRVVISGSKNVALKALVASCLTSERVIVKNMPNISDVDIMTEMIDELGGKVEVNGHVTTLHVPKLVKNSIALDTAAQVRTSVMFFAPLLARTGVASIPNPGGCRIGARPIDRTIDGLRNMGVSISYNSADGYFHAKTRGLVGMTYRFEKNTHTGTETMILAAVLAKGKTVLENAAAEPEVDELIALLNEMGGKIQRVAPRTIIIDGVERLHGTTFTIGPDRNEIVTFAVAAVATGGDICIPQAKRSLLKSFLDALAQAGVGMEEQEEGIRFFHKGSLRSVDVVTAPTPGFMTDWQGPWAVLMTQATGTAMIHETIYENRFGYVEGLQRMGAKMTFFEPNVLRPKELYNFNLSDDRAMYKHAIYIEGPTLFHNAVTTISDLRAGATLVLGALVAKGESTIFGLEHLDRGYEQFDNRLRNLGADVKRVRE